MSSELRPSMNLLTSKSCFKQLVLLKISETKCCVAWRCSSLWRVADWSYHTQVNNPWSSITDRSWVSTFYISLRSMSTMLPMKPVSNPCTFSRIALSNVIPDIASISSSFYWANSNVLLIKAKIMSRHDNCWFGKGVVLSWSGALFRKLIITTNTSPRFSSSYP